MTSLHSVNAPQQPCVPDSPATNASPAANAFAGRDRVLLYTRGMNASPLQGMELALRSLRDAGEGAPPDKVMEELYRILRESGSLPTLTDTGGAPLVSAPPMNRRTMIAKDMVQLSLARVLLTPVRALLAALRS